MSGDRSEPHDISPYRLAERNTLVKKTLTYTDFNGDEVTEDLYFHLTEAEMVELDLGQKGGLEEWLKRVVAAEDGNAIYQQFKKIILFAYGKRSEDGKRFIKNAQIREEFESSEAFSTFIMDLLTNTETAVEWFKGIVPTSVQVERTKLEAVPPAEQAPSEPEVVTTKQLQALDAEGFKNYQDRMLRGEVVLKD